jgi:hypothetical protein
MCFSGDDNHFHLQMTSDNSILIYLLDHHSISMLVLENGINLRAEN